MALNFTLTVTPHHHLHIHECLGLVIADTCDDEHDASSEAHLSLCAVCHLIHCEAAQGKN